MIAINSSYYVYPSNSPPNLQSTFVGDAIENDYDYDKSMQRPNQAAIAVGQKYDSSDPICPKISQPCVSKSTYGYQLIDSNRITIVGNDSTQYDSSQNASIPHNATFNPNDPVFYEMMYKPNVVVQNVYKCCRCSIEFDSLENQANHDIDCLYQLIVDPINANVVYGLFDRLLPVYAQEAAKRLFLLISNNKVKISVNKGNGAIDDNTDPDDQLRTPFKWESSLSIANKQSAKKKHTENILMEEQSLRSAESIILEKSTPSPLQSMSTPKEKTEKNIWHSQHSSSDAFPQKIDMPKLNGMPNAFLLYLNLPIVFSSLDEHSRSRHSTENERISRAGSSTPRESCEGINIIV